MTDEIQQIELSTTTTGFSPVATSDISISTRKDSCLDFVANKIFQESSPNTTHHIHGIWSPIFVIWFVLGSTAVFVSLFYVFSDHCVQSVVVHDGVFSSQYYSSAEFYICSSFDIVTGQSQEDNLMVECTLTYPVLTTRPLIWPASATPAKLSVIVRISAVRCKLSIGRQQRRLRV